MDCDQRCFLDLGRGVAEKVSESEEADYLWGCFGDENAGRLSDSGDVHVVYCSAHEEIHSCRGTIRV